MRAVTRPRTIHWRHELALYYACSFQQSSALKSRLLALSERRERPRRTNFPQRDRESASPCEKRWNCAKVAKFNGALVTCRLPLGSRKTGSEARRQNFSNRMGRFRIKGKSTIFSKGRFASFLLFCCILTLIHMCCSPMISRCTKKTC